jgi:hypothetical protein
MDRTRTKLANSIKGRAQKMYARDLNLLQRVHVTLTYLLSKIWYCAHILPISQGHARQITMCIQWFIWHWAMFPIPTSVSHCPKEEGGVGLFPVHAKCLTLFLARMHHQCRKRGTIIAAWIATWRGHIQVETPTIRCSLSPALEFLRPFFQGSTYLGLPGKDESVRTLKRGIYETQWTYAMVEMKRMTPRIQRKQPEHRWRRIWQNIKGKHLTTTIRALWFRAVHDIIPTNERLCRIRLSDIPMCRTCNQTDTTLHRVTSCMRARDIWHWTRFRIAIMLRTDPLNVPVT